MIYPCTSFYFVLFNLLHHSHIDKHYSPRYYYYLFFLWELLNVISILWVLNVLQQKLWQGFKLQILQSVFKGWYGNLAQLHHYSWLTRCRSRWHFKAKCFNTPDCHMHDTHFSLEKQHYLYQWSLLDRETLVHLLLRQHHQLIHLPPGLDSHCTPHHSHQTCNR